uniref:Mab-21-like HhH/H2TH-like domain-containing protein n=1 Tax=Clytia hemisphaerica TaxID=252671 RepID=A0A7M5UCI3_9CNID
MLWTCEKYPPNDPFWSDDNASIFRILKYMITDLHKNFERRFLPYYFIPEINLLSYLNSEIVRKLTRALYVIKQDVENYLPQHSQKVLILSESALNIINKWGPVACSVYLHGMESPDIHLLLKRPDIVSRFSEYLEDSLRLER